MKIEINGLPSIPAFDKSRSFLVQKWGSSQLPMLTHYGLDDKFTRKNRAALEQPMFSYPLVPVLVLIRSPC